MVIGGEVSARSRVDVIYETCNTPSVVGENKKTSCHNVIGI